MATVGGTPATGWCSTCGDTHMTVTGRCTKCGKPAIAGSTQSAEDEALYRRNGVGSPIQSTSLVSATPDLTRFRLPSSGSTRKWIDTTRGLQSDMLAAAAVAEKKAADLEAKIRDQVAIHKAEAVRFRNAARVFGQLLDQVGVEDAIVSQPQRKPRARIEGVWARSRGGQTFAACTKCGRTDRKHKAKGRCEGCY